MRKSEINVLVCGHDLKFLTPLIRRLEGRHGCTVRILIHQGHQIHDEVAAQEALDWANVIFCEWALGNATWFSQRKRTDQVLVVRLHLQEVQACDRLDFIWTTDWEQVDRLVLITQHVYDWMRQRFSTLATRATLVYNPIPACSALDLPKAPESRFVLGLVGVVPARKRLDLAVDVLKRLRVHDERYMLRVKGALPADYPWMANRKDEMAWYGRVFDDLAMLRELGAVVFDPHGPDMAAWYQGIGHILSVSDFEGSHQAVAEGMATGAVPAIRDWEGSDRIYPAKYVASTCEALAEMVLRHSEVQMFARESKYCREFAQVRFDEKPICDALEAILAQEVRRNPYLGAVGPREWPSLRLNAPTVLIVAYIPVGSRSGYRIRVEQEIQILAQHGCIVHLACLVPKSTQPVDSKQTHENSRLTQEHLHEFGDMGCTPHLFEVHDFFRMHMDGMSFSKTTEMLAALVREAHVDVIHAEALYCARVAAVVKSLVPGILLSTDWHGVVPEESRMGGAHENRIQALETAEKKLLAQCDLNVFVSEAMRTHYQAKYGFKSLHHVTVPCCVADQRFANLDALAPTTAHKEDALVFSYAGTMADWQCGEEMVMLFAALYRYDARCRFTMLVPKSDHAKVQEYAVRAQLPAETYSMTEVKHSEVPARLVHSHVGVLLRRNDPVNRVSSPTKFGEYLAAGIPVLMTDCIGDFSELANTHGVGFIIPNQRLDAKGALLENAMLKEIIAFAERARSEKYSLGMRCQMLVRDKLLWEGAARQWLGAYRELMARSMTKSVEIEREANE